LSHINYFQIISNSWSLSYNFFVHSRRFQSEATVKIYQIITNAFGLIDRYTIKTSTRWFFMFDIEKCANEMRVYKLPPITPLLPRFTTIWRISIKSTTLWHNVYDLLYPCVNASIRRWQYSRKHSRHWNHWERIIFFLAVLVKRGRENWREEKVLVIRPKKLHVLMQEVLRN